MIVMHPESMKSLLARWLFAVYSYFIVLLCMKYNKTDRDCCYRSLLEIVSPQFGKYYPPPCASGNISQTSGKQFPLVTSIPVTICIILVCIMCTETD